MSELKEKELDQELINALTEVLKSGIQEGIETWMKEVYPIHEAAVNAGIPNACQALYESRVEMLTNAHNFDHIKHGDCLAIKKINGVKARYKHSKTKSVINLDNYNQSIIGIYTYQVIDQHNGEVISDAIRYILDSDPTTTSDGGPYQCKVYSKDKGPITSLFRNTFIQK